MRLEIHGSNVEVTDALHDHVERRLGFALGRFAGRLGKVAGRLADAAGQGGGAGSRYRIAAEGVPLKSLIIVEQADPDLSAAIARAADRIGQTIGRRLDAGRLMR